MHKKTYTLDVIPRTQHDISRQDLDPNALKVLLRLNKAGFDAYLVGGCIRDILLGFEPKDFDIATNARPEQVRKLFNNCRLVGRRFRLAHILFHKDIIEVATLRGHHQDASPHAKINQSGRVLRDNVYGSIDEDAERRDFTVNAIYYDIKDDSLRCLSQTVDDLNSRVIRLIGDPKTRYKEDPVRMLRAVRFANKLDMKLDTKTAQPIKKLAPLLQDIHPSRLYDEVAKLMFTGYAQNNTQMLQKYKLFEHLFPLLTSQVQAKAHNRTQKALSHIVERLDQESASGKRISHSTFYSQILWFPLLERIDDIRTESSLSQFDAMNVAMSDIFEQHNKSASIPKRCSNIIREVWLLQLRFEKNKNIRAFKIEEHLYFEKALELLKFRTQVEDKKLLSTLKWWQDFTQADQAKKKSMAQQHNKKRRYKKRSSKKDAASS